MSRRLRIEFPGAFYHVLARGNNKQKIFKDEQDYRVYLDKLKKYHERYKFIVYAYVLMANHFHLLLETGITPLSKIMQGLQQSYAAYFHKKYDSVGHVFQSRYKAILCQRDAYLLELVRYIHLNPVRAGLTDDPTDYFWSSHNIFIGRLKQSFIEKGLILKMFSEDEVDGQLLYRQFIQDGLKKGTRDIFNNVEDQIFLGYKDFVDGVKKRNKSQALQQSQKNEDIKRAPHDMIYLRKKTLTEILEAVIEISGVPAESILGLSRERLVSKARCLLAFYAVRYAGMSNKSIADFLNRKFNTVSYMIRIIDEKIDKDEMLQNQVNKITEVLEA